ncbi:MAG: hypothetical protein V4478_01590 [Patescibacteria group bacterium]
MKPSHIFRNLILVAFGGVLAISLSYANAAWNTPIAAFTDPAGTPPGSNTETPLTVGSSQVKAGGLGVNAFVAGQNAQFQKHAILGGALYADIGNPSAVPFGGIDIAGVAHKVALVISGAFSNTGAIASATLANSSSAAVCADKDGVVVLCDSTTETPPATPKGEFLSSSSYSSRHVGFSTLCYSAGGAQKFINFFGHGGCGLNYKDLMPHGNTSAYQGVVVQLANNGVLYNTLPGFATQNGDIVRLPYNLPDAPAPIWTVHKTGEYAIDLTSTGKITSEIDNGNYFLFTSFDMRVNDTYYPLTANPSATGGYAPFAGHSCGVSQPSFGDLSKLFNVTVFNQAYPAYPYPYQTNHGNSGSYWLDISSPEVQYGIRGSCKYEEKGDWHAELPFNLSFQKTMHFNAGDHVYLYGRMAGVITQSTGNSGGFTAIVDQNTTLHVIEK